MIEKGDKDKKRINIPEVEAPIKPLTAEEIEMDERNDLDLINKEFKAGFDFIKKYEKSVSIFGSSRFERDNPYCIKARELGEKIVKELGYAVITGGGPGIMEAANRGAHEAGGVSLGLTIKLPTEQISNPYVNDQVGFYYFFTRKTVLTFAAEAYVFFPGGFGTLDEFFDILTLVQTHKIPKVPLILVGEEFWKHLDSFITQQLISIKSIAPSDPDLYHITDNQDEILEIIKKAPVSNWWKDFEVN